MGAARSLLAAKGVPVALIKLSGSRGLAPLVGLAEAIVAFVDTGNTLKPNRLRVVEEIMAVSSRLIVNPASLKLKRDAVAPLIEALRAARRGSAPPAPHLRARVRSRARAPARPPSGAGRGGRGRPRADPPP